MGFIIFITDSKVKNIWDKDKYQKFWVIIPDKYRNLWEYIVIYLVHFPSTWLCKSTFLYLIYLKNNYRNKLDMGSQLIYSISSIEPNWEDLLNKSNK